jgi:FMN phosphatase YigB (HAD superfamily)
MKQVPLAGRVIFSDWHGVLSTDPFWVSIRQSVAHPLHKQLEAGMAGVFERNVADEWMKGLLSSDDVIAQMEIELAPRFRDDFLARRLHVDCGRMKVNVDLFEVYREIRAEAAVVIATDNMDCFVKAFEHARSRRRTLPKRRETLGDWATICDDIICSSHTGALKAEDPLRFFGPWLEAHDIRFRDAVLVDDRADNCEAFTAHGGAAIQWKMGRNDVSEAAGQLKRWLDTFS